MTNICKAVVGALLLAAFTTSAQEPRMVQLPAGYFYMGSEGKGIDADEAPIHKVKISNPFAMSATEVTNAEYERFFPEHRALRGIDGVSAADDEAVVNVSWHDAMLYCERLSQATGRNFRLPTEAEWEYACRAGTMTRFSTGDGLPGEYHRNQVIARDYKPVSLKVGATPANAFGLHDMHGNVEEWCLDTYTLYQPSTISNPLADNTLGPYKVTRGGSHHTPEQFLRSANRSAMIPTDKNSLVGFRIVEAPSINFTPTGRSAEPQIEWTAKGGWNAPTNEPIFRGPVNYVIAPTDSLTPFYSHNHQPAVTWTDNGDILAIWFTANAENGREVAVVQSRLKSGDNTWTPATLFFKVPDRNMTGSSLLNDRHGRLIHINGVEAAGDWQNLAMVLRESRDNGATWTPARLIAPRHTKRHQVIAGTSITADGRILQACDAGPGSHDGAALHTSTDGGLTWTDHWDGAPLPDFNTDTVGTTIAGIHAGVVELSDGRLMALGRGNSITNKQGIKRMPMSISTDSGRTWHYSPSEFPPIDGGQRLVLMRLNEGPLLLISFTDHPQRTPEAERGMTLLCPDGTKQKAYGMYAAVSFDDGRTWPVKKLLSPGTEPQLLYGGAWTGYFESSNIQAEPRGYLCATQSPDGMIHLLSSALHYQFNLPWLLKK